MTSKSSLQAKLQFGVGVGGGVDVLAAVAHFCRNGLGRRRRRRLRTAVLPRPARAPCTVSQRESGKIPRSRIPPSSDPDERETALAEYRRRAETPVRRHSEPSRLHPRLHSGCIRVHPRCNPWQREGGHRGTGSTSSPAPAVASTDFFRGGALSERASSRRRRIRARFAERQRRRTLAGAESIL